jgi:hypothetical protein
MQEDLPFPSRRMGWPGQDKSSHPNKIPPIYRACSLSRQAATLKQNLLLLLCSFSFIHLFQGKILISMEQIMADKVTPAEGHLFGNRAGLTINGLPFAAGKMAYDFLNERIIGIVIDILPPL